MTPGGYHILAADDDPDQLDAVGEYLRLAGFRVTTAGDGVTAVRLFEQARPDAAIVDIQMPGLDGFQVIANMRKESAAPDVPIIVISSFDRANLKVKALEMGADDYVVKPVNLAELLARTKAVLRRGERFRKIAGALEGDFADIPPGVLVQTLALGERTAEVRPEAGGSILMAGGLFCDARWRSLSGEPALERLCLLNEGHFQTIFDPALAGPPGGKPAAAVLLSIFSVLDEVFAATAPLGGPDAALRPARPGCAPGGVLLPDTLTPRRWLIEFPGPLREGAEMLLAAWRSGELICPHGAPPGTRPGPSAA